MFGFDLVYLIQLVGYPGLFVIVFFETGIPIGVLFPGSSMLFTAGFLASQGFLDIRILIPLLAVAAILGDTAGYWFGARVGVKLFDRPDSRFFKRKYLEKTRQFYAHYGTRTVLIARFVPFARTFAPILAGIAPMDLRLFMIYNIIGGIAWASGVALLGWILGEALPQTAEYIEYIILGIIAISLLPVAREYLAQKGKKTLPRAIAFDLDGTLAHDFQPMSHEALIQLEKLLELRPIGIISGAEYERIEKTVLSRLSKEADREKLFVFPLNGTRGFLWKDDTWHKEYDFTLNDDDRADILSVLNTIKHESSDLKDEKVYGEQIKDYGSYIAFTGTGFDAPDTLKSAWDPDRTKRERIMTLIAEKLPQCEMYASGRTSIDLVPKGINKAYAVRWLASHLSIEPNSMLFVGDAIYPGGNDYVVTETGIETRQVRSPEETSVLIDKLIKQEEGYIG